MTYRSITIGPSDAGQRLDRYLKRVCKGVPFVGLQKAIRTGVVTVNGRRAQPDARLEARDVVKLPSWDQPESPQGKAFVPTKADLAALKAAVVFDDAQLVAFNKPQGLAAQAGGGQVKSLDRLLVAAYGADRTPKLVHRLDKETTGLILCAKNRTNAAALSAQWAERSVHKGYLALVLATALPLRGAMNDPLAKVGPRAVVAPTGDAAHTTWVWLGEVAAGIQAVLAWPHTGRMNQIRAHFAHHGWPLVGDDKYGDFAQTKSAGKALGTGLALHAWRLSLRHPASGEALMLEAPLPAGWRQVQATYPALLASADEAWQRSVATKHKKV